MVGRIRQLCEENNISIKALERELGFGNGTIRRWDSSRPTMDKVVAVANRFCVSVAYLTGETDQKNKPAVRGDNEREDLDRILRSMTKEQLLEVIAAATEKLKENV